MSFTDRLLLWFHIGFAIFTLGPVAAAMMATPRYIRSRNLPVLRYLYRTTRIFGVLTLGVFVFGLAAGRHDFNQAWFSASMTLFIVAAVLLVLVFRDQRRAIVAIEKVAAAREAAAKAAPAVSVAPANATSAQEPKESVTSGAAEAAGSGGTQADATKPAETGTGTATAATAEPAHIANVERGRIASMGGVICAIWLVILVLMVWHGG